jgi:hypothetical protein
VSPAAQHKSSFESVVSFLGKGLVVSALSAALVGCSGGPTAIQKPSFDPSGSAEKAMEIYDADKDGFIAGPELEKASSINGALKNIDKDLDGKVSEQEIADRINTWENLTIGLTNIYCEITLDGAPLGGASIRFVPEEFMGGAIEEASDITGFTGIASPIIPLEKRPAADIPPGLQIGFYKVTISKKDGDKELVPSKYNSETILGQQVAPDDPGVASGKVRFTLRTK